MKPVLALRHVPHETLGTLEDQLAAAGLKCQYVDQFHSDAPHAFDPSQWTALVVLGGPMNVDQEREYPFLAREVQWIQQALAADLPVLGICLGSQLLAKALGAEVRPNHTKEIGWYKIDLTPAAQHDRLFAGCERVQPVFQWHGDTFDLPEGAELLATGKRCQHQAFRYGKNAYGLQFHWEVTREMIAEWLAEPCGCAEIAGLTYIDPLEISWSLDAKWPVMQAAAAPVFSRFAKVCVEYAER